LRFYNHRNFATDRDCDHAGGAKCVLSRQGQAIATIEPTPGTATVQKDKHDILVTCDKDGYQTGTQYLHSGVEGGTFGNILLGGVIGWGVDSATGADNKYPETASVTLAPVPAQSGTTSSGAAVQPQQPAASQPAASTLAPQPTAQPSAAEAFKACTLPNNQVVAKTESECKAAGGKTPVS
jgi:hypothetical protein